MHTKPSAKWKTALVKSDHETDETRFSDCYFQLLSSIRPPPDLTYEHRLYTIPCSKILNIPFETALFLFDGA